MRDPDRPQQREDEQSPPRFTTKGSTQIVANKARLIVEIDGDLYHASRVKADAVREQKLIRAGYTVLRIPASVVERDLARAVRLVSEALEASR